MKVRMLVSIAGHAMPHYGIMGTFSFAPGEAVELHEDLADKWIESGLAENVAPADLGNLQKKTKAELLAFAKKGGLDLDPTSRKEAIIGAIRAKIEDGIQMGFASISDDADGADDTDGGDGTAEGDGSTGGDGESAAAGENTESN